MTEKPDLPTEHAELLKEQATLAKLCLEEWPIMSSHVAKQRNDRLLAILRRLATIERSKSWKYR